MKNVARGTTLVMAALASVVILVGCGGGGNSPQGVVKRWEQAGKAKDKEALLACLEPESRKFMEQMMNRPGTTPVENEEKKAGSITINKTTINGDSAAVAVTVDQEGAKTDRTINCVKVDGKWYIALWSKEELAKMREAFDAMGKMGDAMRQGMEDATKKMNEGGEEMSDAMKKALEEMQKKNNPK